MPNKSFEGVLAAIIVGAGPDKRPSKSLPAGAGRAMPGFEIPAQHFTTILVEMIGVFKRVPLNYHGR